jgi:hypothetical protein
VDVAKLARGLALNRISFGIGLTLAPGLYARTWVGSDAAREDTTKVLARALGARDLALGAGGLLALRAGDMERTPPLVRRARLDRLGRPHRDRLGTGRTAARSGLRRCDGRRLGRDRGGVRCPRAAWRGHLSRRKENARFWAAFVALPFPSCVLVFPQLALGFRDVVVLVPTGRRNTDAYG